MEKLIRSWQEDERKWAARSRKELSFYAEHGHWPEQNCGGLCLKLEAGCNSTVEVGNVLTELSQTH